MSNAILQAIGDARLVVVAGPGGVGKTTSAAAIAVALAQSGRRTLVLTADPARRLADTLGIDPKASTREPTAISDLPLFAAMLESERTFHDLLPAMVPDPDARARIERSPVYQRFSRSLARSHAYAAIERLHAVLFGREAAAYDAVVLDTPPMRGMLDLIDAPRALSRFAGSAAVDAFAAASGAETSLFGWAARRTLSLLTGPELADALAEFISAFAPFRAGFAERAESVSRLSAHPSTQTMLVTRGVPVRLADADALGAALLARGARIRWVLGSGALARSSSAWSLSDLPPRATAEHRDVLVRAHDLGAEARARAAVERRGLAALARRFDAGLLCSPLLPREPITVQSLATLAHGTRLAPDER